uniref:Uncharacterized protein n=1 Tax=Arundo donax TaxID=35708 RepID=A0A0A9B434_ARUDO
MRGYATPQTFLQ